MTADVFVQFFTLLSQWENCNLLGSSWCDFSIDGESYSPVALVCGSPVPVKRCSAVAFLQTLAGFLVVVGAGTRYRRTEEINCDCQVRAETEWTSHLHLWPKTRPKSDTTPLRFNPP